MKLKLGLGSLVLSSSLWAASTACVINSTSTTDPSSCHLNSDGVDALATVNDSKIVTGNVLSISSGVYSSAGFVGNPGPPQPGSEAPFASASAQATVAVSLPFVFADDVYQIEIMTFIRGSSSATVDLQATNCSGGEDGQTCSLTVSGAQFSPFTINELTSSSWSPSGNNQYGSADVNISVAQFDEAGDPIAFAPEPKVADLLWIGGSFCGLFRWRQRRQQRQSSIEQVIFRSVHS